jgi:hypothetical protein
MNLSDVRLLIRRDLRDEDEASLRWSDDSLDRHIRQALADISARLPLKWVIELPTVPGSREIDISGVAGMVSIQEVEYPPGRFPASLPRFKCWGWVLTLLDGELPDGSPIRLRCGVACTLDEDGGTLPEHLADLLALGAEGYACLAWAVYATNRVTIGGAGTALDYRRLGDARLEFFRAELRRLGEAGSLRTAELYWG